MAYAVGILAIALALLAAPAGGQESKCTAAKHQAAGDYARALEACRAKALRKGVAVDPECDAKALAKLEKQFAKAEKKADCVVAGEDAFAAAVGEGFVADTRAVLEKGEGVCCDLPGPCGWVRDPAHCVTLGGTEGPPTSVCDGSGACVAEPASGGRCCETASAEPPALTCFLSAEDECMAAGGNAFVSPAVCTTSRCVRFEGAAPK